MRVHLDTDFLVHAPSSPGDERDRLVELADSDAEIQMSAVAWYEFARGPRTPEQLAVARSFFFDDGIVPFSEELAAVSSEVFRSLGSPRRRAAEIAIGITAVAMEATLETRNARDFAGIPDLEIETASMWSHSRRGKRGSTLRLDRGRGTRATDRPFGCRYQGYPRRRSELVAHRPMEERLSAEWTAEIGTGWRVDLLTRWTI
jgi:predicted nucleic acid-binding protein